MRAQALMANTKPSWLSLTAARSCNGAFVAPMATHASSKIKPSDGWTLARSTTPTTTSATATTTSGPTPRHHVTRPSCSSEGSPAHVAAVGRGELVAMAGDRPAGWGAPRPPGRSCGTITTCGGLVPSRLENSAVFVEVDVASNEYVPLPV